MRPRVFPAEDEVGDVDHLVGASASMRPRVFPAEDTGFQVWSVHSILLLQ